MLSSSSSQGIALSKRTFLLSSLASVARIHSPAATNATMKRIDAHVHVWAPKEQANAGVYPYAVRQEARGAMLGRDARAI
jgi:hypothetical protein